ncbi:hypothetical protein ACIP9H_18425 [Streptomyces sp. NPDC088732]|uniref:hypothetical protein n=1 Tax=Streptomyces sp. NPDC088732 TaxID=3365879 RepID=UPI00381A881E
MGYLRGFIPWIASGVISSFDWRWGAVAGLVTGLALFAQDRRRGVAPDAMILELSGSLFFAVVGTVALASPDSPLKTYDDALSFAWLALTAWGSLAVRHPFTLGIARRRTPREYWELPGFIAVNNVITAVWGAGFTFICAALAVCHLTGAPGWAGIAAHAAGLAGPAAFTSRYPARVQARLQAAGAAPVEV